MTIGAAMLLEQYKGSRIAVAEALIAGKINPHDEIFASELITDKILQVAKIRLLEIKKANQTHHDEEFGDIKVG